MICCKRIKILAAALAAVVMTAGTGLGSAGGEKVQAEEMVEKEEQTDREVYHVLLVGVDRRDDSWEGNSDSMILVSINDEKEQVSMISLMRDTYVDIPGIGMRKLNAANANGGGELLVETVQENFHIPVERYVEVDFESMQELVDLVGGVPLTLSEEEVEVANGYITDMCNIQDIPAEPHYFDGSGTYVCDGVQAVAYARIRYVGNSDYQRTERQRTVLMEMMEQIREMDAVGLMKFGTAVLPLVTHNIPGTELLELILEVPSLADYQVITDRIPYDGMYSVTYVDGQDMLVPQWDATIEKLKETIY